MPLSFFKSFDESGNLLGSMEMKPPNPIRLQWDFSSKLVERIDEAYKDGLKITEVKTFMWFLFDPIFIFQTFPER